MRRPSRLLAHLVALAATLAAPLVGASGHLADVEVYDRTAGRTLPIYSHEGRMYVAGEPRHQYELRLRNSSHSRVLAVTSVDGVNVISGKTAGTHQGGYVLGAWDSVEIEGWRKNLDEVATFYFTHLSDSYAARTGRPDNVGVIGVALFREQACCDDYLSERAPSDGRRSDEQAAAPAPPAARAKSANKSAGQQADVDGAREREESKLGTGHGHRESSPAQYVDFRRASPTPDETITIYYDSRKNLVAQGVLPPPRHYARNDPKPFPDGFTPDP